MAPCAVRTPLHRTLVAVCALPLALVAGRQAPRAQAEPGATERLSLRVTSAADSGRGSLRAALLEAAASPRPATITFDSEVGPFTEPRTITLDAPLPDLTGDLVIDGFIPDRLWRPSGVTVSGQGRHRVFRVAEGAFVAIRSLTIAEGRAAEGGGILNEGTLLLEGVTLLANAARQGGGVASQGRIEVVNSTFAENTADESGGGLAIAGGTAVVTHCTFSDNGADRGGALFATQAVLLRNSILANSVRGGDCVSLGGLQPGSVRNVIEELEGCGVPISTADPVLEELGYFNGPTKTYPLRAGSPAINLGDNGAAVDATGAPLVWDQRGNGDPRFVAGYADAGAFEHQAFPHLVVDTAEDGDLRGCTRAGARDCPLRGAIELANATPERSVIRFHPEVFGEPRALVLSRPLPEVTADLALDAGGSTITVVGPECPPVRTVPGVDLELIGVALDCTRRPD